MTKKLLLASLAGAVILFVWQAVSWMLLPWHTMTLNGFDNESAVATVLQFNAPEDGIYVLPNPQNMGENETEEEATIRREDTRRLMENGPFIFMSIRGDGNAMSARHFIFSFVMLFAGAFIFSWLLAQTTGLPYGKKVAFIALAALGAGLIAVTPNWNWWGFSTSFVLVEIIDMVIGWTLAGLAIAKIIND